MPVWDGASFSDAPAYENFMGAWSRLIAAPFLDWLGQPPSLNWLDVGCGTGALCQQIVEHCAPASITGVDCSEALLFETKSRFTAAPVKFDVGNSIALSYADATFDAAVMGLAIFFVPEPEKAVAEMVRVVRGGGIVGTYAWDNTRGGFPLEAVWDEMKSEGISHDRPPSELASRIETLRQLWEYAGLQGVETKELYVQLPFSDFDSYWRQVEVANVGAAISRLPVATQQKLRSRVQKRLPTDRSGRITCSARANAVKGEVRDMASALRSPDVRQS